MKTSKKGIIIAIMVSMILAAIETTVVTIAVPTIVKDLNGFRLISWVFSLYLLTSSITTPIYGKLADLYGRKNTLSIGIGIFLIGSFLCGLSHNMYELITFRALQGIGAGSIYTITYTIVGDQFSIVERSKVQGWLSSAWGISSLIGPFVGGAVIDILSWHWIFFINIPFGILSIVLLQKNIKEDIEKNKTEWDYGGIFSLTLAIILLLTAFISNNKNYSVNQFRIIICILVSFIFFIVFYKIEKSAVEPIMPFKIFERSNIIVNIISFISSIVLIGIDVYISIYMQNVLGYDATVSGLVMAPMSVTWFLSSLLMGNFITKYGERLIVIFSNFILTFGTVCLVTLGLNSSPFLVAVFSSILGIGFGLSFTTLTISIQASVGYNMRGAATASNALVRNLGQTIGISLFGSIFNSSIVFYLGKSGIRSINPNSMYSSLNSSLIISKQFIKSSLNFGLHIVFLIMVILCIITIILGFMISNSLKNKANK